MDELEKIILETIKDILDDQKVDYNEAELKTELYDWIRYDPLDKIYDEIYNKAEEFIKEEQIPGVKI